MPVLRDEALVLRTRNLGEADKIVTLFTRNHGKLQTAARGARRARSALLSVTQLFAHGQYLVFQNKTLHNLSQGQLVRPFRRLREDLLAMAYASYFAELADVGLGEEDRNPAAFQCLLAAFSLLEENGHRPEVVAHWYELNMLSLLGYAPELYACVGCRQQLMETTQGAAVAFGVEQGGCLCSQCAGNCGSMLRIGQPVYKALLYLAQVTPDHLADLQLTTADAAVLEELLVTYAENCLEKHLQTLDFLRSIKH